MKSVVCAKQETLSLEERNLFAVAYKNISGERRAIWRKLLTLERAAVTQSTEASTLSQPELSALYEREAVMAREYRADIEAELETICTDALSILER